MTIICWLFTCEVWVGGWSCFEVVCSRYLGTIPSVQNCMHRDTKSRLNSVKVCYHLVQSFLSFHLLSRLKVKVKIYKTIILPFVLYGYELGLSH
jgi:hypothetical protein